MVKRIVVSGANGKMGREAIKMIFKKNDFQLVGAVDIINVGKDIYRLLALDGDGIKISDDLSETVNKTGADLVVDFSTPEAVANNIECAIEEGVDIVVGTTGIEDDYLEALMDRGIESGVIISPNFAIGAVLMMDFAKRAVKFMEGVEVIEFHHKNKAESPSGTALKTVEAISKKGSLKEDSKEGLETIKGARGGDKDGIRIHSVRLGGFVSHQEVIFGDLGQRLTIRFDSISRESFMPGLEIAIRKIDGVEGVVYGLENLIDI
ncbi:4-hydroxy-tetrahydrodipicolinate reductase [Halonatronum saccharophilum]|uniref:4-hydroxy-tetrahydrodipicolinate reductase n=1 Tax=Halonatronum saccharophilum TaxID=150060 RepID=UPI0004847D32|nr:4-hydroxy-tetrahydrodipicolinate reductase [Halonatronum saccharophilum]